MNVQPVVTIADQLATGTSTDWQLVRYERAGRANAFLVMEDDTTHTLDRASMWFRWPNKRYVEK